MNMAQPTEEGNSQQPVNLQTYDIWVHPQQEQPIQLQDDKLEFSNINDLSAEWNMWRNDAMTFIETHFNDLDLLDKFCLYLQLRLQVDRSDEVMAKLNELDVELQYSQAELYALLRQLVKLCSYMLQHDKSKTTDVMFEMVDYIISVQEGCLQVKVFIQNEEKFEKFMKEQTAGVLSRQLKEKLLGDSYYKMAGVEEMVARLTANGMDEQTVRAVLERLLNLPQVTVKYNLLEFVQVIEEGSDGYPLEVTLNMDIPFIEAKSKASVSLVIKELQAFHTRAMKMLERLQLVEVKHAVGGLGKSEQGRVVKTRSRDLDTSSYLPLNLSNKGLNNAALVNQLEHASLSLTHLLLKDNLLSELPDKLGHFSYLRMIELTHNNFTTFPKPVLQLDQMQILILSANQLSALPDNMAEALPILEELHIAQNKFHSIPHVLFSMRTLKVLDVSENRISNVSSDVGQLQNLSALRLCDNQHLISLPESLANIDSLQELDLRGNIKLNPIPSSLYKKVDKLLLPAHLKQM